MINFDCVTKENMKEHNPNWLQILNHPHRILTFRGSGLGKINALVNSISHKLYTDKTDFYAKDPYEEKYQSLINKCKGSGLKHCNDSKAFIEYS